MFLKADNVGSERMSSGRLLQATGPTTQANTSQPASNCNNNLTPY